MATKFELGPDANVTEISTRVRVNNYTDVHAVAELSDGKLYVSKTYVKASGGCSAPAANTGRSQESAGPDAIPAIRARARGLPAALARRRS